MWYFILLLALSLLFSLVQERINAKLAFLITIYMVLLAGLRDISVGRDTVNYLHLYNSNSINERIEPLFYGLVHICKNLGFSYNSFLTIVACLIYFPLYVFLKKWSDNPCLSLAIYISFSAFFFSNSVNVLRNAIAASFVLLSLGYYEMRNKKKSYIMGLLAIGFHFSSFFALVIIFLLRYLLRIKPYTAIAILIGSVIIGLYTTSFSNLFTMLLRQLSLFSGAAVDNYSNYLYNIDEIQVNTNGVIMLICPISLISVLSYLDKQSNRLFRSFLFVGTVLGNIFVSVLYTYRLTTFFTLTAIVVIPRLLKSKNQYLKIVMVLAILTMAVYFSVQLLNENNSNLMPYKFFFE